MSILIQLRRMADALRQTKTPNNGEPVWTPDKGRLYVGDGVTLGGRPCWTLVTPTEDGLMSAADKAKLDGLGGSSSATLAAPTGITATGGIGQATVNWTKSTWATGYKVYYSTTNPPTTASASVTVGDVATTTLTLLTTGTYYFVVVATDSQGSSPPSAVASATVSNLAAPASASASAGNGQATVSWGAVAGATGYKVYYSTTNPPPLGASSVTTTGTSTTITTLNNGTTYYFRVVATANGVEGASSNVVNATPTAPSYPAAGTPTGEKECVGATLTVCPAFDGTCYYQYADGAGGTYWSASGVACGVCQHAGMGAQSQGYC